MKLSLVKKISIINQQVLKSTGSNNELKIFKGFVDVAVSVLGADYGLSFKWLEKENRFATLYIDKRSPYLAKPPRKNGTTFEAFKKQKPLYFSHVGKIASIRNDARKYMRGVAVIPLYYNRRKYGVIDVCYFKAHKFSQEDAILSEYIGNSAAQALALHRLLLNERKVREQEKALFNQKEEFFKIASHELKTPVTVIKGFAQLLEIEFKKRKQAGESKKYISKISYNIDKISRLISDFLDISSINDGKLKFGSSSFELNELVRNKVKDLKMVTSQHHLIYKGSKQRFVVHGDVERLGQVINNLVTNAAKYSPSGTKIIIRLRPLPNNKVKLEVEDFGIGIPEKYRNKVFKRFFQAQSQSGVYQGLGLGLYISSLIVAHHKGTLDFKSKKQGTIFYFILPTQHGKP